MQSYERATIEAWFSRCKQEGWPCTDPLTRQVGRMGHCMCGGWGPRGSHCRPDSGRQPHIVQMAAWTGTRAAS